MIKNNDGTFIKRKKKENIRKKTKIKIIVMKEDKMLRTLKALQKFIHRILMNEQNDIEK